MNHRQPPHLPAGVRRALHCLSLLLVPALTLDEGHAGTRLRTANGPVADTPYLPVLGSPTLRIQEAPPPPDLVTRPAPAAPPVPASTAAESTVGSANTGAALPGADATDATSKTAGQENLSGREAAPVAKPPPAILPDNTRPVIHPEDFLPYFQIPGAARNPSDVTVLVPGVPSAPAPAPIPASSATYTQSPR